MFERIIEQFEAITTALCLVNHNQLCLTTDEKSSISDSLTVLKPFLEATENISGDKFVSVSMIIPLVKLLQQSMRSHLSIPLAAELSSELTYRFSPIEEAYITAVTTLLDPRFKKLPFSTSSSAEHAITENFHQSESDQQESTPTVPATPAQPTTLWDAFDKRVHDSTTCG